MTIQIERHSYLSGASPQRPIEPVYSIMEEAMRKNEMPAFPDFALENVEPKSRITCPCGTVHDGSHGMGRQKGRVSLCANCYREKRLSGLKRAMAEREEIIARSKEPRIVQVDFREWPDLYESLVSEARVDVRTLEQQIVWCVKSYMEG